MWNKKSIADLLLFVIGPRDTTADAALVFQVVEKSVGEIVEGNPLGEEQKAALAHRLAVNSVLLGLSRPSDNIEQAIRTELNLLPAYQHPIQAALYASEWHFVHTLLRQRLLFVDAELMTAVDPHRRKLREERACLIALKENLYEQVN